MTASMNNTTILCRSLVENSIIYSVLVVSADHPFMINSTKEDNLNFCLIYVKGVKVPRN